VQKGVLITGILELGPSIRFLVITTSFNLKLREIQLQPYSLMDYTWNSLATYIWRKPSHGTFSASI